MNSKKLKIKGFILLSVFLAFMSIFSISSNALALWDGNTINKNASTTQLSTKGYAIYYEGDKIANGCVGYRFSLVDKNGNTRGNVIDVYRTSSYPVTKGLSWVSDILNSSSSHYYKAATKRNKVQYVNLYNKNSSSSIDLSYSKQNTDYAEADMNFYTALPNLYSTTMSTWSSREENINSVLSKIMNEGYTESSMPNDSKLLVEPIFYVQLNSTKCALTVTEIALWGAANLGAQTYRTDPASSDGQYFGFISTYTNSYYPNLLYTSEGYFNWTSASGLASGKSDVAKNSYGNEDSYYRATFDTLITKGYGVGIAYDKNNYKMWFNLNYSGAKTNWAVLPTDTITNGGLRYWRKDKGALEVKGTSTSSSLTLYYLPFNLSAGGEYSFKSDIESGSYDPEDTEKGVYYKFLDANLEVVRCSCTVTTSSGKRDYSDTNCSFSVEDNKSAVFSPTSQVCYLQITATKGTYTDYIIDVSVSNKITNSAAPMTPQGRILKTGRPYDNLPTPTRTGYKFDGWYTEASGGTKVSEATKIANSNVTLYAHWSPETVHVYYRANAVGGNITDITLRNKDYKIYNYYNTIVRTDDSAKPGGYLNTAVSGSSQVSLVNGADYLSRTGYTFKGWALVGETMA